MAAVLRYDNSQSKSEICLAPIFTNITDKTLGQDIKNRKSRQDPQLK